MFQRYYSSESVSSVLQDKKFRFVDAFQQVCPTSSILTGAVKPCFKTHPLRRYEV